MIPASFGSNASMTAVTASAGHIAGIQEPAPAPTYQEPAPSYDTSQPAPAPVRPVQEPRTYGVTLRTRF